MSNNVVEQVIQAQGRVLDLALVEVTDAEIVEYLMNTEFSGAVQSAVKDLTIVKQSNLINSLNEATKDADTDSEDTGEE